MNLRHAQNRGRNPKKCGEAIQGELRNLPSIYFLHNHITHPFLPSLSSLNYIIAYSVIKNKIVGAKAKQPWDTFYKDFK